MDLWEYANGTVSLLCALSLSWVTLHPQIDEGLIVKLGLVVVIVSLFATAALSFTDPANASALWRASFSMRCGLCVAVVGVLIKAQIAAGRWRLFSR